MNHQTRQLTKVEYNEFIILQNSLSKKRYFIFNESENKFYHCNDILTEQIINRIEKIDKQMIYNIFDLYYSFDTEIMNSKKKYNKTNIYKFAIYNLLKNNIYYHIMRDETNEYFYHYQLYLSINEINHLKLLTNQINHLKLFIK